MTKDTTNPLPTLILLTLLTIFSILFIPSAETLNDLIIMTSISTLLAIITLLQTHKTRKYYSDTCNLENKP